MKSSLVSGENRGSVNNILLKALQSGDKYGYEINKEIETKSNGKYFLKEASLYSGLKRLQANGYITSYWKDGELGIRRHYYSITSKGLQKLNSSNFSWDSSKEFIDEMFQNPKINEIKQNQQLNFIGTTPKISDDSQNQENNANLNEQEVKENKNPFAYVVSPMQQSLFDTSLFNENSNNESSNEKSEDIIDNISLNKDENNEEITENANEIIEKQLLINNNNEEARSNLINKTLNDNDEIKEKTINNNEIKDITIDAFNNAKLEEELLNKTEKNENDKNENIEKLEKPLYDEIINSYNQNSYSNSLNKKVDKLDLSFIYDDKKENTKSIIFDNKLDNLENKTNNLEPKAEDLDNYSNLNSSKENNLNECIENKPNFVENSNTYNYSTTNNYHNSFNQGYESKNEEYFSKNNNNLSDDNKESLNLQNIFGNLMVDSSVEDKSKIDREEEQNQNETNGENAIVEELPVKKELPRYDVSNNVNITLNAPNSTKRKDVYNTYFSSQEIEPSGTNNIPSVKQYSNNVHKKIITNATNIDDEVNLEGIKVREYEKINNKLIKNSNYVYINKLNMFLALMFLALVLIESAVGITILAKLNMFGVFEIIFFSLAILGMITYFIIKYKIYLNDKYKVVIKNFNLKSNLFYTILIFVVSVVILVCVNIFLGMTNYNMTDFVCRLLFELLITLNIVIYPIIKAIGYKSRIFLN